MSHILSVNQFNGDYVFIGKDGREYAQDCSLSPLSKEDADVAMERIRQGYTYVCAGRYIVRLEQNVTQGPQFEITEIITFDYDDDGYSIPVPHKLLSSKQYNQWLRTYPQDGRGKQGRYAYIDFEAKNLRYMGNPLAVDPTVPYVDDSPLADPDHTTRNSIMSIAARDYMYMKPEHVALIEIIYE